MTDDSNIQERLDRATTDDETDTVERVASGVTITGKTKCGTGTRDQATLKLKGKGTTATEAIAEFREALAAADDGDWGHRLLALNPERDDETDG